MTKQDNKSGKNVGHIGDDLSERIVFSHDELKKRCKVFLSKLILNHSPKEISDYLFELMYYINDQKGDKRLDVALKNFDEEWHKENNTDNKE
ncbi:MAG: hypothetical protein CMA64_10685 [Euryarchaeota archaeon]|nr:hypothetical protein [Euryarchaeota archaeon]